MPATEQTWRSVPRMHQIFAVSALIMLIATLWMFGADHVRQWKDYQTTFNQMEIKRLRWQEAQTIALANLDKQNELSDALAAAQIAKPEEETLNKIIKELGDFAARTGYYAGQPPLPDSDRQDIEARQATVLAYQKEFAEQATETEDGAKLVREKKLSLFDEMKQFISAAKFHEDNLLVARKFKAAEYDVAKSDVDIAVRDHLNSELPDRHKAAANVKDELDKINIQYELWSDHRKRLFDNLKELRAAEESAEKDLAENESALKQLHASLKTERTTWFVGAFPFLGKKWLELPIINAFNSPLKIDNVWSEGLTQPMGNFQQVTRYDRCTTCHRAMEKTQPGSAVNPLYLPEQFIEITLQTPKSRPEPTSEIVQYEDGTSETVETRPTLASVYGIALSDEGLVNRGDVAVRLVQAESLAATARARDPLAQSTQLTGDQLKELAGDGGSDFDSQLSPGLQVGDVLVTIDGNPVLNTDGVQRMLLETPNWGKPLQLRVRRGVPHPFSSHPRLDLFVGSLSPHKLQTLGCTICHEGQGSGTDFKWTSHSPNSEKQRREWTEKYGWFNNHHWIYPMQPKRFQESSCLKCHHEVAELEPSERFPEPPAPELMAGYNGVRQYGCFGCHEINGFDGPSKRIGPDLRLEPNFFAAALQLKVDPHYNELDKQFHEWVNEVAEHPSRDVPRHRLEEAIALDAKSPDPVLSPASHKLGDLLKDVENPGKLRKVGPSLRYVGSKLDKAFLYDWVQNPQNFRPSTKMPRFFGLFDHLEEAGLEQAKRFEKIEILGIAEYLLKYSQPFEYEQPAKGTAVAAVQAASVERGRTVFQIGGCLACHKHKDFPEATASQGPDLSGMGDKLVGDEGTDWLYSWVKSPSHYHVRTKMPKVYLEAGPGTPAGESDPIADVSAFLLASKTGFTADASHLKPNQEALKDLALSHLKNAFYVKDAETYVSYGLPESRRPTLRGAELELLVSEQAYEKQQALSEEQKLLYVGRKAIGKYGCYACHDIPGFEDAKPIGTALADWGRKESSKLAFEHIGHYLEGHHAAHGHGAPAHETGGHPAAGHGAPAPHGPAEIPELSAVEKAAEATEHAVAQTPNERISPFYFRAIQEHERMGFLYQKLREPRSFDYQKVNTKSYNERLRMPQFPFDHDQREQVMTFVLGLVADPPADKFVYHPNQRQEAITEGRKVLEKYNCGGCHVLKHEEWEIAFEPGFFPPQQVGKPSFPFLDAHWTPEELKASETIGSDGLQRATIVGMPAVGDNGEPLLFTEEEDPIEVDEKYDPTSVMYRFVFYKDVALGGNPYRTGVLPLSVLGSMIEKKHPALGGDLARLLIPRVVELEKQANPQAKGTEAWGWLPPPLEGEGSKVQSEWLYEFLLDPHEIRPATFLRMPKFNMSPAEATRLVNYFAAMDNAEYPYEFDRRTRSEHLAAAAKQYAERTGAGDLPISEAEQKRFESGMNIVTNNNYCVKCHIVGDHRLSAVAARAKAPDLSQVYRRLRPDYVHRWVADPVRILPYTGMPVNIPYDPTKDHLGGVAQEIYPGTSVEQLSGLVDLLMNYDRYAQLRSQISPLVKTPPPAAGAGQVPPIDAGGAPPANPAANPAAAPDPAPKPDASDTGASESDG